MIHGPSAAPGLRIGLLGGSFDPPHAGHAHITEVALRTLRLDRVWWLVSPGNPLKSREPAEIAHRVATSRAMMRHPRVQVTDIETRLGTQFTADTLSELIKRYPQARFVWLMGADNLTSFHRWEHWDWIMETVPIGVLARPGAQVRAGLAPAAQRYRRARVDPRAAATLAFRRAPAWSLVTAPMAQLSPLSSTEIRAQGLWP
ncbi:MAG: nicotinate-nucleotide adenylyltransferase [Rhodobacteraceae bacterium]|nr:nicotinate-nucleotide adenylyltransferase [Paracoccaceae bacterium]